MSCNLPGVTEPEANGCKTLGAIKDMSENDRTDAVRLSEQLHQVGDWRAAWDDVTGEALRPDLAMQVRNQDRIFQEDEGVQ